MDRDTFERAIREVHAGDPRFFMENYLMIASKRNEIIPFKFNKLQNQMHKMGTGRDYWLKFRQGGSSLYHLGRLVSFAACIPLFNAAVITLSTDRGRTKERLFRHVHRFIDNLPPEVKPEIGRERADYLEFKNLESQIYIGTVGSQEFGRSETISALMVTELGSFTEREADNVLTSAIESVVPGGIIVFETTPKTMGSHAHGFYLQCKAGEKPYDAHFIPWYWSEDYQLPRGSNEALRDDRGEIVLTEQEQALSLNFLSDGVPVENRIRWRRSKLADRETDFYSEYPEDEISCWQSATHSVFPADRIRQMATEVRQPAEVIDGNLRIYKEASALRRYVIGLDAAGGIPGGDYSAGVVQCVETGEVVAVFHGLVGGDTLARQIAEASIRYGRAMVGGERDAWTLPLMDKLEALGVACYYHDDGKVGFPNTNTSRMQAIAALRSAISDGDFMAQDEPLVLELARYQRTTDSDSKVEQYSAPKGLHDDLCVAAQRAQQIRMTIPGQSFFVQKAPEYAAIGTYEVPLVGW